MKDHHNKKANLDLYNDQIDLRRLFKALWRGKWIIIGITAISAMLSVLVTLGIPDEYTSKAVLAPAQTENSSLSGMLSSQLGGLASIAGINLGKQGVNQTQVALEIMQSWSFLENFINKNDLSVLLIAVNKWDSEKKQIVVDPTIYDTEKKKWLRENLDGQYGPPTSWELYKAFSKRLNVSQEGANGLISISIEYYSPQLAKEWVERLVDAINDKMRRRRLEQANKNIEYLTAQIKTTSISEVRGGFYQLIEQETKAKMLAEASPEYVFTTVNAAMVPAEKSKPKRSLIVILSTILAWLFAVMLVVGMNYFKNVENP